MFKTLIGREHHEFKTSKQCDAQEYFTYVLDKMQKMERAVGNQQYPGDIFEFEVETRVQCQECKGVKYSKGKTQQLVISPPVTSVVAKGTPVQFEDCL